MPHRQSSCSLKRRWHSSVPHRRRTPRTRFPRRPREPEPPPARQTPARPQVPAIPRALTPPAGVFAPPARPGSAKGAPGAPAAGPGAPPQRSGDLFAACCFRRTGHVAAGRWRGSPIGTASCDACAPVQRDRVADAGSKRNRDTRSCADQSVSRQRPEREGATPGARAHLRSRDVLSRSGATKDCATARCASSSREEIKKSHEEYVEQVGREFAEIDDALQGRAERHSRRRSVDVLDAPGRAAGILR